MRDRLIKLLLLILFIGLFIYYYISNPGVFEAIKSYNFWYLLLGCLYTLITITVNGLFMKLIVDTKADRKMTPSDSFYTSYMSTLTNYILPFRGGSIVRAGYLKSMYNFSYKEFVAMLYGNYVLILFSSSMLGLLSILFLGFMGYVISVKLVGIVGFIFLVSLFLLFSNRAIDRGVSQILKKIKDYFGITKNIVSKLEKIIDGWKSTVQNRKLLVKITCLIFVNFFAQGLFYFMALSAVGAQMNILHIILFTSITVLSIFLSVTPGSIGVRETFLLVFSGSLFLTNEQILSATLLDRATTMLVLFILFILFQLFSKTNKPSNIWHDTFSKKK